MTHNDKILLNRMREALLKRHDCRINAKAGLERCRKEIERITGKPMSETPSLFAQQVYGFYDRTMASAPKMPPFKPLVGYQAKLMAHRELCEMTR